MGFVVKLLLLSECTDHFKSQMVNFPSQRLRPFIAILYHHHSSSCLCMKPLLLCDCPHPLQSWVGDPQRSQQAVVGVDQALTKSDSFSFCSEKTPLYLQGLELCAAPLELLLPALLQGCQSCLRHLHSKWPIHCHFHTCHIPLQQRNRIFTKQGLLCIFWPRALPRALFVCLFGCLFFSFFVCVFVFVSVYLFVCLFVHKI